VKFEVHPLVDKVGPHFRAGTYCGKIKCDIANQLVDANYGGTSLGVWLSVYDDVHFHADNNIILHSKEIRKLYIRTDACSNHLIFHKSSFNLMTLFIVVTTAQLSQFRSLS
jgi:hypothetical protein